MNNISDYHWTRALGKGDPDLLFNEDGSVRLPKLVGLAIRICGETGMCFTRQPTQERADAVVAAANDRIAAKGLAAEIRPGTNGTFGAYLVAA